MAADVGVKRLRCATGEAQLCLCTSDGGQSGRALHCADGLLKGETVLTERPQCSVVEPRAAGDGKVECCGHCQRSLLTSAACSSLPMALKKRADLWPLEGSPVSCGSCSTLWCTPRCRDEAMASYHAVECGAMAELEKFSVHAAETRPGGADYASPLRLALRMAATFAAAVLHGGSWASGCAATRHPHDDGTAAEADQPFAGYSSDLPPAFQHTFREYAGCFLAALESLRAQVPADGAPLLAGLFTAADLSQQDCSSPLRRVVGVSFCNCLGFASAPKHVFFRNLMIEERARAKGAPLVSHLHTLTPSERGEREGEVRGVGLYPLASLLNHGCRPNCGVNAVATPDHTVRVVCVAHAPPMTSLRLNYLEVNASPPKNPRLLCTPTKARHLRRARLRRRWGFDCECRDCEEEGSEVSRAVAAVLLGAPDQLREQLLALCDAPPLRDEAALDAAFDAAVPLLDSAATVQQGLSQLHAVADKGHQPSEHMLGCAYTFEEYGVVDIRKAEVHLRRAAVLRRGEEPNAAQSWGVLSELLAALSAASGRTERKVEIKALTEAAARQGYGAAQVVLAEELAETGDDESRRSAWLWAEAAAAQDVTAAEYLLGIWASRGQGVWDGEPNYGVARRWLRRATDAGFPGASEALAALPDQSSLPIPAT